MRIKVSTKAVCNECVVTARFEAQTHTATGAEVARLRAAGECDDVYFDVSRKRIYVIGGAGLITVFQQNDPYHYELVANVPPGIGIRTGYFLGKRDRLYVGVPEKGNEPQVWTYEAED